MEQEVAPHRVGETRIVVSPSTPAQEEEKVLRSAGQRRVNIIWEVTQSAIALLVTLATLYASVKLVMKNEVGDAAFLLLSNAFFLVIGFYFGRTNHERTGGVSDMAGR